MHHPIRSLAAACVIAVIPALAQQPTPLLTRTADQWVAVLKSEAPLKEKADACRELAVIGGRDAVPALVSLLPDEKLSHMARYALETVPDPAADDALLGALGRLQGRPLVGVIGSIGVRRSPGAVPALAPLLDHANGDVAEAAARSLGRVGTTAAYEALMNAISSVSEENLVAFCEGLARTAERLSAEGRREEALAIYDHYTDTRLPHQVRTAALRGTLLTGGAESVALLGRLLKDPEYLLFSAAVRTSRELPGSPISKALAEAMSGVDADRQIVLLQALGRRGDASVLPSIHSLTRGAPPAVGLAAVRVLPEIGSPTSLPVLTGLMTDVRPEFGGAAMDALAGFPGREADALAVGMLKTDNDPKTLSAGIELVGRRRLSAQAPALLEIAGQGPAEIRPLAMRKVGELAPATELPAVLGLLMKAKVGGEMDAATQAATALSGRAGNADASAGQVAGLMSRAEGPQKQALLRLLASIGGPVALEGVRAAVGVPDAEVRATAIRMLGTWKTADAAPALLELARSAPEPADRTVSLQNYLQMAADADLPADQRLAMCRQGAVLAQRPEEKKLLLGALGSIKQIEALELIGPYLDDAATRNEAGAATVAIAEEILKGSEAGRLAPKLIDPLKKVAGVAANTDLGRRADAQLRRAQEKAAGR